LLDSQPFVRKLVTGLLPAFQRTPPSQRRGSGLHEEAA
jgi:hypothetical protein